MFVGQSQGINMNKSKRASAQFLEGREEEDGKHPTTHMLNLQLPQFWICEFFLPKHC